MLSLEVLTEVLLKRIKAAFANLADTPGPAHRKLTEASEHIAQAGEKVEQAQEKVFEAEELSPLSCAAHDKAKAA